MARGMTRERAYDVRDSMKVAGFDVTVDDVLAFARDGYLYESTVGLDYDEARDEALLGLLTAEEVQFDV